MIMGSETGLGGSWPPMPVATGVLTDTGKVTGNAGLGVKAIAAGVPSTDPGSNRASTVNPMTFSEPWAKIWIVSGAPGGTSAEVTPWSPSAGSRSAEIFTAASARATPNSITARLRPAQ
ncbi:MAG: hypothetical protein EXS64_12430 [Candidatus Latescibacteria bacterium]|nr:hypothetical protein [Candidatus Latescibacterota bacterium]